MIYAAKYSLSHMTYVLFNLASHLPLNGRKSRHVYEHRRVLAALATGPACCTGTLLERRRRRERAAAAAAAKKPDAAAAAAAFAAAAGKQKMIVT